MVPAIDGNRPDRAARPNGSAPSSYRWVSFRVTGRRPLLASTSTQPDPQADRSFPRPCHRRVEPRSSAPGHACGEHWHLLTGCAPKRTEAEDFVAGTSLASDSLPARSRATLVPVLEIGPRTSRLRGAFDVGQLRLHEHDLLEVADDADADGDDPRVVFERMFGRPGSTESACGAWNRTAASSTR